MVYHALLQHGKCMCCTRSYVAEQQAECQPLFGCKSDMARVPAGVAFFVAGELSQGWVGVQLDAAAV
jgi:hypothetical protein